MLHGFQPQQPQRPHTPPHDPRFAQMTPQHSMSTASPKSGGVAGSRTESTESELVWAPATPPRLRLLAAPR